MNATERVAGLAPIQKCLQQIAAGLKGMDESQKNEILAEIASHLSERVGELRAQGEADAESLAIAGLGDAAELAARFVAEARSKRGARSYVPWTLLGRAARIAGTGARGFGVFVIAVIGYGTALAAFIAILMKPFVPGIGLWVGSWGMVWGLPPRGHSGHELLGNYFTEATAVLAFVFACGTTLLLRRMLSKVSFLGTWPAQASMSRSELASGLHQ
jgi:uncharacterized membrane protein